jgi:2-isopropylmalate synthase
MKALVSESQSEEHESIQLVALKVSSETDKQNSARVVLSVEGKEVVATADTSGAVDATFSAINSLVDVEVNFSTYKNAGTPNAAK